MKKVAFIGAGSLQFTTSCVRDLLTFPSFKECEFALMDINPDNLAAIKKIVEKILLEMNCEKCRVTVTSDRTEALKGADGVLCTVFNGDIDVWENDIIIPKKYGVDINIGDTRSVSGIFRALRNIPLMLDICRDIEKYCPRAVFFELYKPHVDVVRSHAEIFGRGSDGIVPQRAAHHRNAVAVAQCAVR